MSVLLDEDTIVLEGLEFEIPCVKVGPEEHAAENSLTCRSCGAVIFACDHHIALTRVILATNPWAAIVCLSCDTEEDTVDGLYMVVPL
ncbi:hypothetical protein [uncultured Microbacterium sp.]|uniref:hypothetical protein n=1 Tax=uncultured Microbacterium sp. TaxID=191216 RepID=UPI0025D78D49|nr:hypothetical protein [uncultured Microbacterium sp.]